MFFKTPAPILLAFLLCPQWAYSQNSPGANWGMVGHLPATQTSPAATPHQLMKQFQALSAQYRQKLEALAPLAHEEKNRIEILTEILNALSSEHPPMINPLSLRGARLKKSHLESQKIYVENTHTNYSQMMENVWALNSQMLYIKFSFAADIVILSGDEKALVQGYFNTVEQELAFLQGEQLQLMGVASPLYGSVLEKSTLDLINSSLKELDEVLVGHLESDDDADDKAFQKALESELDSNPQGMKRARFFLEGLWENKVE